VQGGPQKIGKLFLLNHSFGGQRKRDGGRGKKVGTRIDVG